jgi:hypothetical protein
MIAETSAIERCEQCNEQILERTFCHYYPEGITISLCSPACAREYLIDGNPATSDESHRGLSELIADLRWRDWGE